MPTFIHILTLLLLAADTIGSPDKISKYFFLSSREIMVLVTIGFIALRLTKHRILNKHASRINHIVTIGTLAAAAILTVANYMTSTNFIFATTRIQITQLLVIAIYTGIVSLLTLSDRWYEKYYRQLIYFSAPAIAVLFFIAHLFPFEIFVILAQEDNLIETLQVVVLAVASVISVHIARMFIRKRRIRMGIVFSFFALALFFVGAEEISWGQRIFGIHTPTSYKQINVQHETNIHNLEAMGNSVSSGYILLGFYGMVAWIVQKKLPLLQKDPFAYFIPGWYTVGYYFIGFLYNYYIRQGKHGVGAWSEYVELMLYTAVMVSIIGWSRLVHRRQPHQSRS